MMFIYECKLPLHQTENEENLQDLINLRLMKPLCAMLVANIMQNKHKLADINTLSISVNPCLVNGYIDKDSK